MSEPAGSSWFGTGIGLGAIGLVMVGYYAFYWSLLGLWTPGPWMWLSLVALALPALLLGTGILLLVRRRRAGFLLVSAALVWLVGLGFNDTWALTSGLVSQLVLIGGAIAAAVGFFRSRV